MKTIWKFKITKSEQYYELPAGARVLRFAPQNGSTYFWALLDQNAPLARRAFGVFGTGWDIPDDATHMQSCEDGPYIWHLFELVPRDAVSEEAKHD